MLNFKFPQKQRLACHKHGEHDAWFVVAILQPIQEARQGERFYCIPCLEDALARMGVHCMFPADESQSPVDWPKEVDS